MSPKKNPFTNDPIADVAVQQAAAMETLNSLNTLAQDQARFYKQMFDDSGLSKWIILAGVGGLCELVRIIVDAVNYFRGAP